MELVEPVEAAEVQGGETVVVELYERKCLVCPQVYALQGIVGHLEAVESASVFREDDGAYYVVRGVKMGELTAFFCIYLPKNLKITKYLHTIFSL